VTATGYSPVTVRPSFGPLPALALALGPLVGSCALLNLPPAGPLGAVTLPSVTFGGATLVGAPSGRQLAAYYCPELVSAPFGTAGLLCEQLFGPRPDPRTMNVAFDLRFHIVNPNQIPLPVASVLAAATVFPATASAKLGAVCLSLCPAGAAGCTGGAPPGACEASSRDVRSLADFMNNSVPQLLIANGLALAAGQPPSFVAPQIVASGAMDITARYAFGPEQLLAVLRQLAAQSAGDLRSGRAPSFTIPYRLEGTIWFDAGSIGRLAVGWGPTEGTWTLPVEGLLPP
jgi:hypothetical protein